MSLLQFVCAFYVFGFVVVASSAAIPDGVIFPDQRRKGLKSSCDSCTNAIPISLAKQLSNVDDSEQFLHQFVENGREFAESEGLNYGIRVKSPFAQSTDASKKVPIANCKPELQTINLKDTNDPTVIYYPMCVRLEQCAGCCNHELLMCQYTKSSPVNVTIMMTKYMGNKTLKYIGKKIVTLLRHNECQCDCKTKAKDCRGGQIYKQDECRCVCANGNEEQQCTKQHNKLWNPATCQCACRNITECSSGYFFDQNSCSCRRAQEWQNYDPYFYPRENMR
ncbi:hypothetical protein V9T40_006745 [Parthenolecanium corni]|uniref:Platelet-derived growth factor (PDGF) family profile domain-containing protein n=1 Tax=Parthenolecanium corni TaxID=536013 RepID=A0AAN9TRB8_9HEMI